MNPTAEILFSFDLILLTVIVVCNHIGLHIMSAHHPYVGTAVAGVS